VGVSVTREKSPEAEVQRFSQQSATMTSNDIQNPLKLMP
jgi:hypothetical protein